MPPAKATRKSSTTVTSSQPKLRDSFAAVRTAKDAVTGISTERKKSQTVTPIATSVATPPVETKAPKLAPKKVLKKRNSTTDEDSEEEDDYEPISPTLETDRDGQHVIDEVEVTAHDEEKRPQLDVKDKSMNKHLAEVNEKMGFMRGIHTEDENKFHKILRVFDLSYEYGPCVGVSRLERWNRANGLGLEPPVEVRDILLTQQGEEEEEFAESIFYRRV